MGIKRWIGLEKKDVYKLKAIIIYPNKKIREHKIKGDEDTFSVVDTDTKNVKQYAVDSKAIHFFGGEPVLFYNSNNASPLLISEVGHILPSLSAREFRSIIKQRVVQELLEASKGESWDLSFILTAVNTGILVIMLLSSGALSGIIPGV